MSATALCRQITSYCEFGDRVIDQTRRRVIQGEQVLEGNPADTSHVRASLERHQEFLGCAPDLYAADRDFHSTENLDECEKAGVSQVGIPQRGGQKTAERKALERTATFKKGNASVPALKVASRCCFAGEE